MNGTEAAAFVNNLALQPGWVVYAEPYGATSLRVQVGVLAYNSNEAYAPNYERSYQFTTGSDPVVIDAARLGRVELCGEILRLFTDKAEHEHREFLRYYDPATGRWVAPFHPHREEGIRNWDNVGMAAPALR